MSGWYGGRGAQGVVPVPPPRVWTICGITPHPSTPLLFHRTVTLLRPQSRGPWLDQVSGAVKEKGYTLFVLQRKPGQT